MHGYISDLHWAMPECTHLLYTMFIPYMELHTRVNVKNLTSCVFPKAMLTIILCTYLSVRQFTLFSLAHISCTLSYNVPFIMSMGYDFYAYRLISE